MANIGSTSEITGVASSNTKITNKTITLANTEYSHALTNDIKQLFIKARGSQVVTKVSFTNGESGTKYITIPARNSLALGNLAFQSATIYVQCNYSTTLEILELY